MIISVSGSLSAPLSVAEPVAAPSAATQTSPKTATPADVDSVKLFQAAQVRLFKQQGQSLSQISSNLSIPIATVYGYLGIQTPKPTATNSRATTCTEPRRDCSIPGSREELM